MIPPMSSYEYFSTFEGRRLVKYAAFTSYQMDVNWVNSQGRILRLKKEDYPLAKRCGLDRVVGFNIEWHDPCPCCGRTR